MPKPCANLHGGQAFGQDGKARLAGQHQLVLVWWLLADARLCLQVASDQVVPDQVVWMCLTCWVLAVAPALQSVRKLPGCTDLAGLDARPWQSTSLAAGSCLQALARRWHMPDSLHDADPARGGMLLWICSGWQPRCCHRWRGMERWKG